MENETIYDRRSFLESTVKTLALSPLAAIVESGEPENTYILPTNGYEQPARSFNGKIRQINAGELSIGYVDEGPEDASVVLLFHGWPYDINSYIDVVPLLVKKGYRTIVPYLRGYGTTRFLSEGAFRNAQQSVLAVDAIALMDALKIEKAIVAGFDWGARTACIMAILWPERCKALVSVSGYLVGNQQSGKNPLPPSAELQWWYQFYFATERGREGYEKNREAFAKLIWQLASPVWKFSDAVFNVTAEALSNPDHVDIVIHNYRWRLGLAEGDSRYNELEEKLATAPVISIPTITIEGDGNGAPHPAAGSYAAKYTGKYKHRVFKKTGHNPPQESPQAFADAIIEVDGFAK